MMLLSGETRPAHVPYRALLPNEIDNLLLLVCVSATHVGLGTIRVEPTLMHIAESAAWATVLALRDGVPVSRVSLSKLQALLLEHSVMLSYFSDFDMAASESWKPAVQYYSARGFFPGYEALPERRLTARSWSARSSAQSTRPRVARSAAAAPNSRVARSVCDPTAVTQAATSRPQARSRGQVVTPEQGDQSQVVQCDHDPLRVPQFPRQRQASPVRCRLSVLSGYGRSPMRVLSSR